MKSRLFNLVSALSLVVCIALSIAWGLSHWVVSGLNGTSDVPLFAWLSIAITGIVPIIWLVRVSLAKAKMRRQVANEHMKRRLFMAFAMASLALSVTTAGIWLQSYWSYDLLAHEAYSGVGTELISFSGRVVFYHYNSYAEGVEPNQNWGVESAPLSSTMGVVIATQFGFLRGGHWWNRVGFVIVSSAELGPHTSMIVVMVPHWFLVGVFAIAPAIAGDRFRMERRIRNRVRLGHCQSCGYDIRATPDRCPECGKPQHHVE